MTDLEWCVAYLKEYNGVHDELDLPLEKAFRALMNITMPAMLRDEFYRRQDSAIKQIQEGRVIVIADNLVPLRQKICLYKGDITALQVDAIVNAGNEKLLGCFVPLHGCIDNAIHSFAGLQVRRDLAEVMRKQGVDEPNGRCKVTPGYNLPSRFILHTVGPCVRGRVRPRDEMDLRHCYLSCLKAAEELGLRSIAFCSISTGLYGFPIELASKIAIETVDEYLLEGSSHIEKVVFNVFSEGDYDVYYRNITSKD